MNTRIALSALFALASLAGADEVSLFNGKDLTGWEGRTDLWSVRDGCITGQTSPDPAKPGKSTLAANTFLIWKGGEVSDFELELEYGQAISTFVYSTTDWDGKHSVTPLYHNIKEEGILI